MSLIVRVRYLNDSCMSLFKLGNPKPCYEIDLVKEFLWNIEGKANCELMDAHSKTVNNLISEIAFLKKRNSDLIHIRMQECDDLETANQRLEAQLDEMQAKLSDRNVCPYSYAAEVAAQCVKHQQEKDQVIKSLLLFLSLLFFY